MHEEAARLLFENACERIPPEVIHARGWKVNTTKYPVLDLTFDAEGRTPLRLRMTCDDWNDLAPSIDLLEADGRPLSHNPGPSKIFHPGMHPRTGRRFICMPGTREYHQHDSHVNDPWENYRHQSKYDLFGIVTQVWNAWYKGSS